ncbi:T9SS C-terminal target domain-containing protein [bacterium]|nr:MAG: T9SS C-terminal target domain-containing protein [bacterium]
MKSKKLIITVNAITLILFFGYSFLFATPKDDYEQGLREELKDIFDDTNEMDQFIEHAEDFKPIINKEEYPNTTREKNEIPYYMIIITNEELLSIFLEFAEIKDTEGIKTQVVTTSVIGNTPDEIRAYLKIRKLDNPYLKYVLIGGDASVIMPKIIDVDKTDYSSFPTDYYFCNVLSEWVSNDEINFEADLYVGRIPADTVQEVQNFIDKYVYYRQAGNFSEKYHLIANNLGRIPGHTGGNSIIDFIAMHIDTDIDFTYEEDLVSPFSPAGVMLGNAFNTNDHSFLFNVTHGGSRAITALNSNSNWNVVGDLADYPNSQQITNVYEWSVYGQWNDTTGYYYEYLPDYLTNTNPYILWNSSCASTKFVDVNNDPMDCVGACFLMDNNGAAAYYGVASYEFPYISRLAVEDFMDFVFLDEIHEISINTINSLQFLYPYTYISSLRNLIIAHILFGDPSMEIWSKQAENLVTICKGGNTFKAMDFSGNAVDATIVILNSNIEILGRGESPYSYPDRLDDSDIITSNSPNYLQAMNTYGEIKEFSGLPYEMTFEEGIDNNWEMFNSTEYGRTLITEEYEPYESDKCLIMDVITDGYYSTNEAWLHLNLVNQEGVEISFFWKEFDDEDHFEDGVYISDKGGEYFEKIYSLKDNNNKWERVVIELDEIVKELGMRYTNDFVLKFQHYDNDKIPRDGFAFDDINVYSNSKDPGLEKTINAASNIGNYPNPFTSETSISFSLKEHSHVKIVIYNVKGERVSTLMNENRDSGTHTLRWDGTDLSAGIYFIKLMVNDKVSDIHKTIILR